VDRSGLIDFELKAAHQATEPPEARGLRRDEVRLLVSHADDALEHRVFHELPSLLNAGDLLVVNASGTLKASLPAQRPFGMTVDLHIATWLPGNLWTVEVRERVADRSMPMRLSLTGEGLLLPAGGRATLLAPYPFGGALAASSRLWLAALELPFPMSDYLERYGSPIRYTYESQPWPSDDYQTIFATEPGSAEMPSAGRPFTPELVTELQTAGVSIAPLILHTGVSSLEDHEPPYEERYRVPVETARHVNRARATGHRVIAVGTTVVRALETVTDDAGVTHPGEGWTNLVIAADAQLRAVDGLLTGFHEPRATHLSMIRAVARRLGDPSGTAVDTAYREALTHGYLWHEFGDAHLILP
jgi:S-adenosylmethionine:tRNA ribosyltransferase-isomerase